MSAAVAWIEACSRGDDDQVVSRPGRIEPGGAMVVGMLGAQVGTVGIEKWVELVDGDA
jgi:hypothetical protein